MLRLFSVLFAALLVGSVFLLPRGDRPRLAALKAYELIADGTTTDEAGEDVSVADLVFATPAYTSTGEGTAKFLLGGARLSDPQAPADNIDVHGILRDGLVRGIRQAAGKQGIELELVGDMMPAVNGLSFLVEVSDGQMELKWNMPRGETSSRDFPWLPPNRNSLLPPLFAICLALLIRRPVPALFLGVLTAAFLLRREEGASVVASAAQGFVDIFRTFLWGQLRDNARLQIIAFVVAMLAMVGIVTRNGGIRGVMNSVSRFASGVRSTQLVTYLMGLLVFFDDYANTILVGGTMRPLTDKYRIAREKLAYIVDSTAAPVAGLSIFSTWIAFEVSTFSAQLPMVGLQQRQGYEVFIDTLPYRFYCIFSLAMVAIVVIGGRDFGPMLGAERRARRTGKLVRDGGQPLVSDLATTMEPARGIPIRAFRAVVPLMVFIGVTLFEIVRTGMAEAVLNVVDEARDGRVVANADSMGKAAAKALSSGQDYSGDFDYDKVPATWEQRTVAVGAEKLAYPASDGEKWVDVNLSNHTMTAYVGSKAVLGPVKMVDGQDEKPTVVGTFKVYLKRPMMTMRGNNADGTRYETPDVPWVAFFHRGYALHGAPWRSSFGYSASHGCVNLPVDVAKAIYDFAPIGTPVTTHF